MWNFGISIIHFTKFGSSMLHLIWWIMRYLGYVRYFLRYLFVVPIFPDFNFLIVEWMLNHSQCVWLQDLHHVIFLFRWIYRHQFLSHSLPVRFSCVPISRSMGACVISNECWNVPQQMLKISFSSFYFDFHHAFDQQISLAYLGNSETQQNGPQTPLKQY